MEKKCRHKFEDNITLDFKGVGWEDAGRVQEGCDGNKTRKSAVGVVTGLWAGRSRNRGFDPRQTGSGAHPFFCSMGAKGSLPGGKGAGREAEIHLQC